MQKLAATALSIAFVVMLILSAAKCSADTPEFYVDIGIGYKLDEAEMFHKRGDHYYTYDDNGSPTAHIAAGVNMGKWRAEISHDSNWFNGAPFNGNWEYQRTELRVVRRFTIW